MKRRLNVLTVFVILLLLIPVFRSVYFMGRGIELGVDRISKNKMADLSKIYHVKQISVIPDDFLAFQDSVKNEKTGENIPAMYTQMGIVLPLEQHPDHYVLFSWLYMFSSLCALLVFVFIIVSVNKSKIFTWKNVSGLRWLGVLLIVSFLGEALPHVLTYFAVSKEFALPGYSLTLDELVPIMTLILGLVAFIFAEIFAIGLRMQEDQELTI